MGVRELVSQTGYTISLLRVLNRVSSLCKKEGDMGFYGIELFFKQYSGNFDFNVRYCGII